MRLRSDLRLRLRSDLRAASEEGVEERAATVATRMREQKPRASQEGTGATCGE